MPRRKAKPHPSTLRERDEDRDDDEANMLSGHPEHGDPHPDFDDPEDDDDNDEEDDDDEDEDSSDRDRPLTRMEADSLRREMEALKQTNAALLRQVPPREPIREDDEEEEIDWDSLIFSNPKEAMRLMKEQAKKEISKELRGEYQKDQGEKEFWKDFNERHPDLKGDRDLVEVELQKNLAKLGDMPVQKAIDELADLTRKRIMRYSGGKGRRKSRAVAEGAGAPSGRKPAVEKKRPTTLSDVLKARAEARRKAQTVA